MKQLIIFLFLAFSQTSPERNPENYNLENGVAIYGYDPVSYFQGESKEGDIKFSYKINGITYYFSSSGNKELFVSNPEKYEPQYGGWCAYAMGDDGSKVEIDPETYKIVDGKLYLFYNKFFTNTLKYWNKDEPRLKKNADENWKKIVYSK